MGQICSVCIGKSLGVGCEKSLECGHVCNKKRNHKASCECGKDECSQASSKSITYSPLTKEELRQVMAAMQNIGDGKYTKRNHWYQCSQGHPYFVGDCGSPVERVTCYECGVTIGKEDGVILGTVFKVK